VTSFDVSLKPIRSARGIALIGRTICLLILISALAFVSPLDACAKVRTISTDGEATIYLMGDYSRDFDLAYNVVFDPAPANRSWSSLTLSLLGPLQPSASISVGLTRGYPKAAAVRGFIASSRPRKPGAYKSFSVRCSLTCGIELRGDKTTVYALVNGRTVGTWDRKAFRVIRPYVQLNGEVNAIADRISARLYMVRALAGGKSLKPTCAFTTQGVEPRAIGSSAVAFSGSRRQNARVTYISLMNGSTGDSCPRATAR
jgi:hypothetical protein